MIAVTGATGCLGVNLTRALIERGETVAAVCRPGEDLAPLGDLRGAVELRSADVRDRDGVASALRGADAVFHLAGIAVQSNTLAREMREVNVGGTENVMHAAADQGARMIHTSSVSAIGLPDDGVVADETFAFNGEGAGNAYVLTKRQGEMVVKRYADDGADAVILNPAAVMAAGGDPNYGWPGFVQRVAAGKFKWYPGGGVAMVGGADVVSAHLRALDRGRSGERYIIAGTNLPYRLLIDTVAEAVGVAPARGRVPDALVKTLARVNAPFARLIRDPLRRPLVVPENVPLLTRRLYYSGEKARRELGVDYSPLADAVSAVVEWCRSRSTVPARSGPKPTHP